MSEPVFTVTTSVPEKPAVAPSNEALATKSGEEKPSEPAKPADPVKPETAEEPASEPIESEDEVVPEETDPEDSEPEEKLETKPEDPKPKKKTGFQRTKDKLNREIEFWKTEAIKNQRQTAVPVREEPVPVKANDTGKPDKAKFATHDDYIEAVAEWKADQKFKAIQEEQRQNSVKAEAQRKQNEHFQRLEAFKEANEDFDDVWGSLKVQMSLAMGETIKESELGPELMYALAKDQKECARIAKLSPLAAARELGKLEVKVSKSSGTESPGTVKPQTIVKDATVNPVRPRGASNKKSIYDPDISVDDFIQIRNADERAKAARR